MKLKSVLILSLLFSGLTLRAQLFDYNWHQTYRYTSGSFTSPETYFADISDNGMIAGYYKNESGTYSGLVYLRTGKVITYNYTGYNNTEITGINDSGYVAGRAYNSPSDAIVWRGKIGVSSITGITEVTWYYTGATFQNPKGMNKEGVISGSIQTGTTRWMNNVSAVPPVVVSQTKRYSSGGTFYNTYGLGISDAVNDNRSSGYYLSGTEYKPFIYSPTINTFTVFNHVLTGGTPGTRFNDINNSNHVAVYYKNGGLWQGTVGKSNLSTGAATYDATFPFQGAQGSSVMAINNSDDIAGWFKENDTVTAYFALVSENKIPGYDFNEYSLSFSNGDDGFSKTLSNEQDPWTGADSFYHYYLDPIPWLSPEEKTELQAGHRYPDWAQYVLATSPDSCYFTAPDGNTYPLPDALGIWLSKSEPAYKGNCYGMVAFTWQYLTDRTVLQDRFWDYFTFYPGYPKTYTAGGTQFDELVNVISALHLYQNGLSQDGINNRWDARITAFQAGAGASQMDTIRRELDSIANKFYEPLDRDSLHLMSIWFSEAPVGTPFQGAHAIAPFKVSRYPSLTVRQDTVYAYDPNKPEDLMKVLIDYDAATIKLLDDADVTKAILGTVMIGDKTGDIGIAQPFEPYYRQPRTLLASQGAAAKTAPGFHSINVSNACDYTLQDLANPSLSFQQSGMASTNNFPGLHRRFRLDGDAQPIDLVKTGDLNVKSTLSSCSGHISWNYAYPNGNMIFARNDALPAQQDEVATANNWMEVHNPDAVAKTISVSAIAVAEGEQSLLIADSLLLPAGDSVALIAMHSRQYILRNGNTHATAYKLHVRFTGAGGQIIRNLNPVPLSANTNHTILIQPAATAMAQVIILVDSLQDGVVDDTLFATSGPTGITALPASGSFRCYPSPAQDQLTLAVTANTSVWQYQITDITGRLMTAGHSDEATLQLQVKDWAPGSYFVTTQDASGKIIGRSRFVKR